MPQIILSDENCGGQAEAIFAELKRLDYVALLSLELKHFADIELEYGTDDEIVWQFCQQNRYILLTGNRTTTDGEASLEMAIRHLMTPDSLPVLTIGNLKRLLKDPQYCHRCAENLGTIVMDLEDYYLGVPRLYV